MIMTMHLLLGEAGIIVTMNMHLLPGDNLDALKQISR